MALLIASGALQMLGVGFIAVGLGLVAPWLALVAIGVWLFAVGVWLEYSNRGGADDARPS